jgi:hypothetical protein
MLMVLVPAEMLAAIVTPIMLGLFPFLSLLRFEFMLAAPLWMPVAVAPLPTGVSVQSGSDRGSAEGTHASSNHSTLNGGATGSTDQSACVGAHGATNKGTFRSLGIILWVTAGGER